MDISNESDLSLCLNLSGNPISNTTDVVWFRRCKAPSLSDEHCQISLTEDDRRYAEREIMSAYRDYWRLLSLESFWVNPLESAERSKYKMLQLYLAKNIGFKVPKTRVSNSPGDIKDFLSAGHDNGCIYKPFYSAYWSLEDGGSARLPTTDLDVDQLPSDNVLKLTPGIFQEKIKKKYEVRATFMGANSIAVKIDSQSQERTSTDWRVVDPSNIGLEPIVLPDAIYRKCMRMMNDLKIVFGCFDFIVTADDEYVFLEVNEAGQFLWIERALPDIPMLDMMSRFLGSCDPDFIYKEPSNPVSYAEIVQSKQYVALKEAEKQRHIDAPSIAVNL